MATQATEATAHATPPHSAPQSEREHSGHITNDDGRAQKTEKQSRRPPKTRTERRTEERAPPLRLDNSPVSGVDATRQDSSKRLARRPRRTAAAAAAAQDGDQGGSSRASRPQNGQQAQPQGQQVQSKGKGAPSLRLDLNLDIEITLKAKIKGSIELSIL
ncbi:hypothetical protein CTA2_302 [Colletotrichum tanaceti]|uniref:Uncharacterized protein n=1 Tax=Colletotrichum tanaceti TaxID=1306861 RepID=A0A4U6X7B6_9PEZI|nr:hypothetical protein CTA2_302 [Colletotrichum tanaceti]TKW50809.1 hypothetical protein CTA1_5303 [Colletotrichum tanaceti]